MEDLFTDVYERKECIIGSGPGLTLQYNVEVYIPFLRSFIIDNKIKTVVDLGCGDCQCLKFTYDKLDIVYNGYDCVYKNVLENNLINFKNEKYNFIHLDFFKYREFIFGGDLCILKDVLCHWKLECIYSFCDYLVESKKFKYILIINCAQQVSNDTDIVENGQFHPLSCAFFPLKNMMQNIYVIITRRRFRLLNVKKYLS